MHAKWDGDMIPYGELPDDVKEWNRFEARGQLASAGILPPYLTDEERKSFNTCVVSLNDGKSENTEEARIDCFRGLHLQCTPEWKKSGQYCE